MKGASLVAGNKDTLGVLDIALRRLLRGEPVSPPPLNRVGILLPHDSRRLGREFCI